MKKVLAILLVLSMLLGISACGAVPSVSSDSAADSSPLSAQEASSAPSEQPASTPAPTSEAAVSSEESEPTGTTGLLEQEIVLADDENCTFKLVSVIPDNPWGYTWNVYLENKTEQNLMFFLEDVSINGIMCDPFWATIVLAGSEANQEINWAFDEFERIGITDVTAVEFRLSVYDSDDPDSPDLLNDTFTVYPLGEDAATYPERTPEASDLTLFDTDDCTMIVTGFDPDGSWGYTVNAYLVNKTDQTLIFSIDNATVNNVMCNPFWSSYVAPGKISYASISWSPDDFETNDITAVEQIQLDISVTDDNFVSELLSDSFTIEP